MDDGAICHGASIAPRADLHAARKTSSRVAVPATLAFYSEVRGYGYFVVDIPVPAGDDAISMRRTRLEI